MDTIRNKLKILFHFVLQEHDYTEIFKGAIITFFLRLLSFVLIYVLNFVIAKLYRAEALGNYTLAVTILDIGTVIALIGMDTAVVRFISQYRSINAFQAANRILNRMIYFTIPVSILLSSVLWIASEELAENVFHNSKLIIVFHIVSLLFPPTIIIRLYASAFRGTKKVGASVLFDLIGIRLGNLVFLFGFIVTLGLDDAYILYSLAIAIWINALLSSIIWNANAKKLGTYCVHEDEASVNFPRIKEIISVSLPLYLTASMYLIMGWTDTLMLGFYKDEKVVGIYSVVLKLSQLTNFAFISFNTILLPKISELFWGNQKERLQNVVVFFTRIMFLGSVPVLFVLSLLSDLLLSVFGGEFTVGTVPLIILCIGQLINCSTGSVISLLNMTGHQKYSRNVLVAACVVNIVGNLILIPPFGMVGAASATAASSIIRDVLASYFSYKIFGFHTWYLPFRKVKIRFPMR